VTGTSADAKRHLWSPLPSWSIPAATSSQQQHIAWESMTLANDSVLNMTNNAFDLALTVAPREIPRLANNLRFRDIKPLAGRSRERTNLERCRASAPPRPSISATFSPAHSR